ncbi:MAG: ArsR family transcriptional regulator [archaeon]|nr:ArsR family transcriptional regulator [archaeon]
MDKTVSKPRPIQIFSKKAGEIGVNVVKSPVKLNILSMLKDNDMEFDEIVKNTGKSKSTISVHLKSLREDGIVNYRFDSNDHRKKIFFIDSKFLGEVEASNPVELEEKKIDFLVNNILDVDDFKFSFLLFHTLRSTLIQEGININPVLFETGKNIGFAIFEKLYDDDFNKFIDNLCEFWETHSLGYLDISVGDIIKINNSNCFECGLLPKKGKPVCFLDAGIFDALFSAYLKLRVNVTEVKCNTMGDECCSFLVEFTDEEFVPPVDID